MRYYSQYQEEEISQESETEYLREYKNQADEKIKPIIFLSTNLSNRLSGKKQHLFDIGELAKNSHKPESFIKEFCDDAINSYHMNNIGNTHLFYPGIIEEKSVFKVRVAQGAIDIIIEHFINMVKIKRDNQILIMVSHHKAIEQFMRIINKSDVLQDKPCYCWTAEVELQIERDIIEKLIAN
jgi:hypothetical protein